MPNHYRRDPGQRPFHAPRRAERHEHRQPGSDDGKRHHRRRRHRPASTPGRDDVLEIEFPLSEFASSLLNPDMTFTADGEIIEDRACITASGG